MEMQTIMVIILIAYSSKCYNFVFLHAAKKNERAVVFVVSILLQANANNNLKAKPVCTCVCVFELRVFFIFSFSLLNIAIESMALVAHTEFTVSVVLFFSLSQLTIQCTIRSTLISTVVSFPMQVCMQVCVCSTVRVQCALAFISFEISCFLSLGK